MKILLLAPASRRRLKLIRWFRYYDALVVGVGLFPGIHLLEEIARTSPHVVVIALDSIDPDTAFTLRFVEEQFPSLRVVRLLGESGHKIPAAWQDLLRTAFSSSPPLPAPQPYASSERLVFHDPRFNDFVRFDKLSAGSPSLTRQTTRLRQLLETGRRHHALAKNYLAAIQASLPGLEPEICYRMVHKSYKGLSWARELIAKYVSVLAHYVPGVEVRYLPLPAPLHPSIDYVPFELGADGQYAVGAVIGLEINPAVTELLAVLSHAAFTGQEPVTLLSAQTHLMGMTALMEQIAIAHVSLMDRWLDPHWTDGEQEHTRKAHRERDIFRDFWDLESLFATRATLPQLIEAFHGQKLRQEFSYPPAPPFAVFLKHLSTGESK